MAFVWWDHSFSKNAKFPEKLTYLTSWYTHVVWCAYQGVRNISFSENFVSVQMKDPFDACLFKWDLLHTRLNSLYKE